jgi:hypothetical protein
MARTTGKNKNKKIGELKTIGQTSVRILAMHDAGVNGGMVWQALLTLCPGQPQPQVDFVRTEAAPEASLGVVAGLAVPQEALQAGRLIKRGCR